jgi:hypothetical protein
MPAVIVSVADEDRLSRVNTTLLPSRWRAAGNRRAEKIALSAKRNHALTPRMVSYSPARVETTDLGQANIQQDHVGTIVLGRSTAARPSLAL